MEAERNKTNDLKKRSYQVRKKWSELSPNQKRRILADARFVYAMGRKHPKEDKRGSYQY